MYSVEHLKYLRKTKRNKMLILFFQILILITLLFGWEILVKVKILNSFLTSSPSKIIETIINLYKNNNLISHVFTTVLEIIISFSLSTVVGIVIASLLWWYKKLAQIIDPYLTIINSLPKVSLGPLIIIWMGANTKSIIFMTLLISVFTTIINMYNAFAATDKSKIILLKSLHASKIQIFTKLIFRSNLTNLLSTLKINISLTLIGVIMGELIVSKAGLGYLITYGSQVFNLNLVITSVFILGVLSYLLYMFVDQLYKKIS